MHSYRMDKSCRRTLILTSWYLPGIMLFISLLAFFFLFSAVQILFLQGADHGAVFLRLHTKPQGSSEKKVSSRLEIPYGLYENYSFDWWKYSSYITRLLSMMHLQRPAWILPEVNEKQSARTMALKWLDVFCNSFTDQYGLAGEILYT